jgi:hypothetical protein
LFLGNYKKLRTRLLKEIQWNGVTRLGEHAFDSSQAAGAFVALLSLTHRSPREQHNFSGINAASESTSIAKAAQLRDGDQIFLAQNWQLANPDARVVIGEHVRGTLLSEYAESYWGQGTGDFSRFGRCFWEFASIQEAWSPMQSTIDIPREFGGCEQIVFWEKGRGTLIRLAEELRQIEGHSGIRPTRGAEAWGKRGICVSLMRELMVTRYEGHILDGNCAAIVPKNVNYLSAIWAFCSSPDFNKSVRSIDQKINVTNHTLLKVPFDIDYWQKIAAEKYPQGLPRPFSEDPTQWLFNGQPRGAEQPLQVGVARLLGYRWPRQTGSSFHDCAALTADGLETLADNDGIVCLTATKGEGPADERIAALLSKSFGAEWSAAKLASLLADIGYAGKSLDDWLRDGFFSQHCELFHRRPFVWHFWDGRRDGFHALVNYHRLTAEDGEGRRTVEKLIYSYLGDWIDNQRSDQKAAVEGADARLAHAEHLKAELIKILEGEPPYDIFVHWKPLREQPLGWDPDVSDGVRMNIRPFMTARPLNDRTANACILRATPKIKWEKDRGKEMNRGRVDYPWFWGWDEQTADFAGGSVVDGNRWNDLHYGRATKQAARDRYRTEAGGKR